MPHLNLSNTTERFVVTGPSGWLGRSFIALICGMIGADWPERLIAFGSHERVIDIGQDRPLSVRPLSTIAPIDVAEAHVLHLAHLGAEQVASRSAGMFIKENTRIDDYILTALSSVSARSVFVSSSGMAGQAALGKPTLYGAGKLVQETRFLDHARLTGTRMLVGRVFNVAGPYMNKQQAYALGAFLLQARREGVIDVTAPVPVYRSYLHVMDLAELVIRELIADHGRPVRVEDLCGPLITEMQDVALAAAAACGLPRDAVRRGTVDCSRPSTYLGDPTIIRTAALRHGMSLRSFAEQVADTAQFLATGDH